MRLWSCRIDALCKLVACKYVANEWPFRIRTAGSQALGIGVVCMQKGALGSRAKKKKLAARPTPIFFFSPRLYIQVCPDLSPYVACGQLFLICVLWGWRWAPSSDRQPVFTDMGIVDLGAMASLFGNATRSVDVCQDPNIGAEWF